MNIKSVVTRRPGEGTRLTVLGDGARCLVAASESGGEWSLWEWTVPRDSGPPPHTHPWDETYFLLEGQVDISIDGKMRRAGAGELLYAPGGMAHTFKGASDAPARMLVWLTGSEADAMFHELASEIPELPPDLDKIAAVFARHRVNCL
ncbi:MAG: cupin domain-containing protein [Candidatus Binataceae bacterium]